MRLLTSVCLILCLLACTLISGCGKSPAPAPVPPLQSSPDRPPAPIPLRNYAAIGDIYAHARLQVLSVKRGEAAYRVIAEASPIAVAPTETQEFCLVTLNVVVDTLLPNHDFLLADCVLMDADGTTYDACWIAALEAHLGLPEARGMRFTAMGSQDCFLVFSLPAGKHVTLRYPPCPALEYSLTQTNSGDNQQE